MPQIKTKRRQDRLFKKIKTISLLACLVMIMAIGDLIYQNYFKNKLLFLNPLSDRGNTKIEESLKRSNINYRHFDEYPNYYILQLQTGEAVIISKNKDIGEQLSSLQLIQSRLKIEGKEFRSLDMRYAQPVIKQ